MSIQHMIERGVRRHGDKFDASELTNAHPSVQAHAGTDTRVVIESTYSDGSTWRRAGRIGVTTGWRPALLVMWRNSQVGSSDVVSPTDRVVAVQHSDGRYYDAKGNRVFAPRGTFGEYAMTERA